MTISERYGQPQDSRVVVNQDQCTGCEKCLASCPTDIFRMTEEGGRTVAYAAYPQDCCDCFLCELDCPAHCITINFAPVERGFVSIYHRLNVELPAMTAQHAGGGSSNGTEPAGPAVPP
jgi:NAD-dependent dihydropyrimidine dehydrogenase PreA subunit